MTDKEYTQYWKPARDIFGGWKSNEDNHPSFLLAKAIGVNYPELGWWKNVELTDELKNLLLALASPYRETMLKIYQIRKGLK